MKELPEVVVEDVLGTVKRAVPLSTYVERFTRVKRSGASTRFMAFCPFHDNTVTEAMTIDDVAGGGLWHCHAGCGGGSVFDFYILQKGGNPKDPGAFSEALTALASERGVTLPEREGDRLVSAKRLRDAVSALAEEASIHLLDEDGEVVESVRSYLLDERAFPRDLALRYSIGFIPSGRSATRFVLDSIDGDEEAAIELDLLRRRSRDGSLYSPYAGRLVLPISDSVGPVGLAGRLVPGVNGEGPGKWVNPKEGRLYSKSSVLYGMGALGRDPRRVAIVEGYFDAIAVTERTSLVGVAACGTSVTVGQTKLLEKAEEAVFVFDGDVPGTKALAAAYWTANRLGDRVSAVVLDEGSDPWSLEFGGEDATARPGALDALLTERATPLLPAAVAAKSSVSGSDSEFDKWVSEAVATLNRADHRDAVIRAAAGARSQSVTRYGRTLTTSALPARREEAAGEGEASLDPNMALLIGRVLAMSDDEREGVLATLSPWTAATEAAVRDFLPVASDLDVAAFARATVGASVGLGSPSEVDRALARMIPSEDAEPVDVSVPLRSVVTLLSHEARAVTADGSNPALARGLLGLRRAGRATTDVSGQGGVLAVCLDLALDVEAHRDEVARDLAGASA